MGEMDNFRTRRALVTGNLALLQVQALIVASAAGVFSFMLGQHDRTPLGGAAGAVPSGASMKALESRSAVHTGRPRVDKAFRLRDGYFEFALVLAVAQLVAFLTSAIQGSFVCAMVVCARKFRLDPDNLVVPIVSSLGDITTLTLMGLLSSALLGFEGTGLATVIMLGFVSLCVVFTLLTIRNTYVRELLAYGWVPLLTAGLLSSLGGLALEYSAAQFDGYALLAPVVAGVPGMSAAVHTSRLSSALHSRRFQARTRPLRDTDYAPVGLEEHDAEHEVPGARTGTRGWLSLVRESLQLQVYEWTSPLVLLCLTLIIQFAYFVALSGTGALHFGWGFSVCLAVLAVGLGVMALYVANTLCLMLWYWDHDPDISCLPFVTALIDAAAQWLLYGTFCLAARPVTSSN